jgi:hypothetical protein
MVVAIIALVAALAGTGYAATKINGGRLLAETVKLGKLTEGAKNKTVGIGKATYVQGDTKELTSTENVTATCPVTRHVTGGGVKTSADTVVVHQSHPLDSGDDDSIQDDGWKATVSGPAGETAQAHAVCAPSLKFKQIIED